MARGRPKRLQDTMDHVSIHADAQALARALAREIADRCRKAVAARGTFHLALSGGSTPGPLYALLAGEWAEALPWDAVHLWYTDERCVPPTHPWSNHGLVARTLLAGAPVPRRNEHRMRGELGPERGARLYAEELARDCPQRNGLPVLDMVLLGMGGDGHTASLFPGHPALDAPEAVVAVADPPADPAVDRITLGMPALDAARHAAFLVAGESKAAVLRRVLRERTSTGRTGLPAARVRPATPAAWHVDRAAAAQLEEQQ
jgi:6-phosphogluconolactonase